MKETMRRVTLAAVGIAPRCRKTARHTIDLGYVPFDVGQEKVEEIKTQARAELARFRDVNAATLRLDLVEREKHDGYSTETWSPFSPQNIRIALI